MRTLIAIAALTVLPASALAKDVRSQERVACSIAAALKFQLAPELLLAIAEMEGGKPGQWVRNDNGSHDVGPMQFNTKYLAHLEDKYGIRAVDVATAGCYPYEVAAWRLRRHLDRDRGDLWTRAANYHSRAPAHNAKYRRKLIAKAASWRARLHKSHTLPSISHAVITGSQRTRSRTKRADKSQPVHVPDAVEAELLDRLGSTRTGQCSASKGKPHAGTLEMGTQVPAHRGYTVLDRNRAWGAAHAVEWLASAFDALVATEPDAPVVQVHDMSLRNGGQMRGHRSHQSGRDVDITYFHRTCRQACGQRKLKPRDLDAPRQWKLLAHWLERNQLEFAFVDYALQQPLYEAARAAGATAAELARWFQYPRGATALAGIIRHVPRHADHVHVRFRCAAADTTCTGRSVAVDSAAVFDPERELLEMLE